MKKYIKPTLEVNSIDANNIMCASAVNDNSTSTGYTWDETVDGDNGRPSWKPFKPQGGLEQW